VAAQTWEEIVAEARLSAEEQKVLDNIVKRVPEFKEGRLRQADYSRQSLEVQKQKKEAEEAIAYSQKMRAWADEKVPIWEQAVADGAFDKDGTALWKKEQERLNKELQDAKAAAVAGADMDPAELTKRVEEIVRANGGVTKAEFQALMASEAAKIADERVEAKYKQFQDEFNTKTIPFNMGMSAANALAALDYERVTGEKFTADKQKELFGLMNKENNFDPRAVMEVMLEPVRKQKETEAEIEKRVKARLEEERKQRGYTEDQPYIPIPGVNQPKGSLQAMLDASAEEGDVESKIMAAGKKAAAELRNEGKY
jgi:hypothetical protein